MPTSARLIWLTRLFLLLWALQGLWVLWELGPDVLDSGRRLLWGPRGAAVRLEDPFYLWILELSREIPPSGAYLFLDRYERGKEIEARYHLFPRRHVLGAPNLPPSYLFYLLRHHQAGFLVAHTAPEPLSPEVARAVATPAFSACPPSGRGLLFRVDLGRLQGDFYD
ncbi:MAG: hypothetical protein K6T55_08535 [Syntrophobacterales bacterium]|nr:hypothetical protein [Syntrophobacterales bacterium]